MKRRSRDLGKGESMKLNELSIVVATCCAHANLVNKMAKLRCYSWCESHLLNKYTLFCNTVQSNPFPELLSEFQGTTLGLTRAISRTETSAVGTCHVNISNGVYLHMEYSRLNTQSLLRYWNIEQTLCVFVKKIDYRFINSICIATSLHSLKMKIWNFTD